MAQHRAVATHHRARWFLALYAACLLLVGASAPHNTLADEPRPPQGLAAATLTTLFSQYGDTSGAWSGADRTASVPLPDGRLLWLFSDTFLGRLNADGSRPRTSPFINNSAVIQEGDRLRRTLYGGTPAAPEALVPTGVAKEYYWIGDASVTGDTLQVLVNRYRRTGPGPLDHALLRTALASFALPDLTPKAVRSVPSSGRVSWGSEVLADRGFTYVYGTEAAAGMKFAHVARVAGTDLSARWQYWTGRGWSASEKASGRVMSGVGTSYGVQRVGTRYVLVTHENNLIFSADFVAYTASSPVGPFEGPHYLLQAPEAAKGNVVYDADVHPSLARSGKLLFSYNVNNLDEAVSYADPAIYRPRFVEVDWPPRPIGDDLLPGAPADLVGTAQGSGSATLTWRAPPGDGLSYHVYRRDGTAGQTHFVRLPATTQPGYLSDSLVNGHTYEFAVAAVNKAGEGPRSAVTKVVATVPRPPSPADVVVTPGTAGEVSLRWDPIRYVQLFRIYQRDLTAGETRPMPAGTFPGTSTTIGPLQHGHDYEFTVVAIGGGGDSAPSTPVRATVFTAAPGAPQPPTAVVRDDGSVTLTWPPLTGPHLSYRVYNRDVTAGETRLGRPTLADPATTYTVTGLIDNHEYEFAVAVRNLGGEGPLSAPVRVRVRRAAPTAAPTDLRAKALRSAVELTWQSRNKTRWHWVYRRDVTVGEQEFARDEVAVEGTTATIGNLLNGHTYEFKVVAFNAGGEGPAGPVVRATPQLPQPTGLKLTATGPGTAHLTWDYAGPGLVYVIQRRDVTAGEQWQTDPLPSTSTAFDAIFLIKDHRYEYRISAADSTGAGRPSAVVSVTAR